MGNACGGKKVPKHSEVSPRKEPEAAPKKETKDTKPIKEVQPATPKKQQEEVPPETTTQRVIIESSLKNKMEPHQHTKEDTRAESHAPKKSPSRDEYVGSPSNALASGEENQNIEKGDDQLLEPAPVHYIEQKTIPSESATGREEKSPEEKEIMSPAEVRKRGAEKKKMVGNYVEDEEITENLKIIEEKKISNFDLKFIIKSLTGHFVFYSLNEIQMEYIVKKMFYCKAEQNSYVFEQGDERPTSFFILEKGEVVVEIDKQEKRTIGVGEAFGDLALLYSAPRSASIYAKSESFFWGIDRKTFRKTLEEMISAQFAVCRKFLDSITFFSAMTKNQKDDIANALSSQRFKEGQDIVRENDQASSYYIIQSGEVSCVKEGKEVRRLVAGDTFGEQALYFNSTRTLTVKAASKETTVLALGREELTKILGGQVQQIIYKNWQRWAYEKNPVLEKLTKLQVERLIEQASYQNKQKGDVIAMEGAVCDEIIVIIEGSAIEVALKCQEVVMILG